MDVMAIADRSWSVLRRVVGVHTGVYKATGGLIGHRFPGLPPTLLLNHTGAKSGIERTTALTYIDDAPDLVLVASKGGHPRNPAWFHNLKANPDTTVQIGRERRPVHAHVATPEQRERLWPKVVATYGGYADYQRRTEREIPLVILSRR